MTPSLILEEQWIQFKSTAVNRGVLPGGIDDWNRAWYAWRMLDQEHKEQALADVAQRPADSFDMSRGLPQNYLERKRFTRPLPAKVEKKTALERMFE